MERKLEKRVEAIEKKVAVLESKKQVQRIINCELRIKVTNRNPNNLIKKYCQDRNFSSASIVL